MVNVGTLSLGVKVKGASQARKQADRLSTSVERLEGTSSSTSGTLSNLGATLSNTTASVGNTTQRLQRLVSWLTLSSARGSTLATVMSTLTGAFAKGAAIIGTVVSIGGKLVAGLKAIGVAVGAVIGGISATTVAIGALVAGVAVLVSEILGITDVTRVSMDSVRSFFGTVTQTLGSLASRAKEAFMGALGSVRSFVTGLFSPIRNLIDYVTDLIERIDIIPDVSISGGDGISMPSMPSVSTSSVPGLHDGGVVEDEGIARVHEGEAFIPEDLQGDSNGSGGEEYKEVNINQVRVSFDGDIDLSDLSRRQRKKIAEDIADDMGDEISKELP